MKSFLAAILCLLLSVILTGPLPAVPIPGCQVITRQQIQQAGLNRLADIFYLIDDWDTYTIDGFTWYAAANQLAPYDAQSWILLIDGHELKGGDYGLKSLNAAPLSIDLVDSILVISEPQIYQGYFTDQGLIHIFTKKTPAGISYQGRFMYGNETGDPGPYRYTPYRTPNVDRIGADGSNFVSLKNQYFSLTYNYLEQVYYPTDVRILERNRRAGAGDYPRMDVDGYYLKGEFQLVGLEQTFYFSNSNVREYRVFDFLIQEMPVLTANFQGGMYGSLWNSQRLQLNYYLDFADNQIHQRRNLYDIDFDWRLRYATGRLDLAYSRHSLMTRAGIGIEQIKAQTTSYFSHDYFKTSAFAAVEYLAAKDKAFKLDLFLLNIDNRCAFKTAFQGRFLNSADHETLLSLSYSKKLFQEENPYWRAINNSYRFSSDPFVYSFRQSALGETQQITLNGQWSFRLNAQTYLETELRYRLFQNNRFIVAPLDYAINPTPENRQRKTLTHQDGQIVGLGFKIRYKPAAFLKNELIYNFNKCIAGDDLFNEYWQRYAPHKISFSTTWNPVPDFSVWSSINYLSETTWYEYEETPGKNSILKEMYLWDCSLEKWFWEKRIRANLIFRNLLNKQAVFHPAGASLDLRYYVQMELKLDSIFP